MPSQSSGASPPRKSTFIGSLGLAKLRQRHGVSLEEIAEKTKISIRFLRAIESEDFDQLPGGLFSTSYIRQYAAAAGIDESDVLAQYSEKTAPTAAAPQPRKAPGSETRNRFGRWLGIAADTPR